MKSDAPKTQYSESFNKREFLVFFVGILVVNLGVSFLGKIMGYKIVLLLASIVSIGNAIYYGVLWKDLKKSVRLGLGILFSLVGVASFLFYKFLPQTNNAWDWNMMLGWFLGCFVGLITFVFIYKHKTLSFWGLS